MNDKPPQPSRLEAIKLAAAAETDIRSAQKYLRGEAVRGLAGERLKRAASEQERPRQNP